MLSKGEKVVAMQNLQAMFVQGYAKNNMSDMVDYLFTEESSMDAPERGIKEVGKKAISAALEKLQNTRQSNPYGLDIMCLNTPGFDPDNNRALWDAYVYEPGEKDHITYVVNHFDVDYVEDNGVLKISRFVWNELASMVPWKCTDLHGFEHMRVLDEELCDDLVDASPEDFVQIQKLQARFSHWNRKNADMLFSSRNALFQMSPLVEEIIYGKEAIRECLDKLAKKEAELGRFLAVPLISAPFIRTDREGKKAKAQWMCMCFSIDGSEKDETNPIVLHIGRFNQSLIKEAGIWKFSRFCFEKLCCFHPFDYSHPEGSRYDRMSRPSKKWLYGTDNMGGTFAEDVFAIESIIPQWTYRLRSGDQVTILDEYLRSDYRDIYKSLRAFTYTRDYGYETLKDYFIQRQDASFETSMPAFHTATTPWVEINVEGNYARAVWLDHSISDLFKGKLNDKQVKEYAAYIGKYEHEFAKEDGKWRWIGVGWEPLISLPVFEYDTEVPRGWMDWKHRELKYPKPFERYIYED